MMPVDERSLAAQHASSRRCMHACACERMQPSCVGSHTTLHANTRLCSPTRRLCSPTRGCLRQQADRLASSHRYMHASACEPTHPAVLAVIRRCMQTRDCAPQHAPVLAKTPPCLPKRTRVRELDGLIACRPPRSRVCGCAPKFCAVPEDPRLCSRAAPPVR